MLGSVKGTVYQDNDLSGDQSSGDTSLPNWTVTLYDGASTAVRSTKSASDGSYTLSAAFTNPPYTVCEAPPSGSWAQTEPDPQKPNVCPTGQLPKGYQFTPSGITDQIVGDDFGNVPAQGCTTGPFGPANYQLGTCKPTNSYVFSSGTLNTDQSYVAYWTGDQTQPEIPQVENVTLDDPIVSNQPKYTGLMYSNAGGVVNVSTTTLAPMPYCLLDPRTGEYTLDSAYTTVWDGTLPRTGSGLVLPGTDTACAISIKTYVDASGKGHLQAYVYALGDSIRSVG